MAISSANTFPYKYLEESKYKFNPSQAFTSVPELNIAKKIPLPFEMAGIDFTTGKRVNIVAPKKEKDGIEYPGSAVPMNTLESDLAALDALANKNLQRSLWGYQMQQQADLAALPKYSKAIFDMASKTRGLDYQLGLAADIFGPTRQQARMASAGSTAADLNRSIAAQAQAAALLGRPRFTGKNVSIA